MRTLTILSLSIAIFSCGESSQKSNQIIGVYDMKVELNVAELEDPIYVERGGIISLMGKTIIRNVLTMAG
jgi:hypothetical protein